MNRFVLSAFAIAAGASACAPAGPLPLPPAAFGDDSGGLVTTLGNDTLAMERFAIRGNTLRAEVVMRTPRTYLLDVSMAWNDRGRVTSYEVTQRNPANPTAQPSATTSYVVGADSIRITRTAGTNVQRRSVANAGISSALTLPAYSPVAVLARHALARSDTLVLAQFGNSALPFTVRTVAPATYSFAAPGLGTLVTVLDARGRLHSIDARSSTLGAVATRVSSMDLEGWTRAYVARDAAGTGLGPLSPPDTVEASVGAANVTVAYQRPSRRGRVIFGGVVPWDAVWRTGANTATGLTTDRDLTIGGVAVPAGSYTLWTIPSRSGWQLIVNRQTGQWGTVYNQDRDLTRIPMNVERLATPVEQFTIAIDGGRLSIAWDDTRAWVPIAVAP